jgi:formate dehydrogenase major subunit
VAITAPPATHTVTLSINGQELTVPNHDERYDPVGVCRVCAVEVGARVYAADGA